MRLITVFVALCVASSAMAEPTLKAPLADLGFLVGEWKSDNGKVADTGGTSKGRSLISVEADGGAILRRDRTDVFDANGKPAGGFSQLMMIYPEGGAIKAVYEDGEGHLIHYDSSEVSPGSSVTFTSAPGAGPVFRLTYQRQSADTLSVRFGMIPPGLTDFHLIASGTLKRAK